MDVRVQHSAFQRLAIAGGLIGFALGGFFDGIVLHQVLQFAWDFSGLALFGVSTVLVGVWLTRRGPTAGGPSGCTPAMLAVGAADDATLLAVPGIKANHIRALRAAFPSVP